MNTFTMWRVTFVLALVLCTAAPTCEYEPPDGSDAGACSPDCFPTPGGGQKCVPCEQPTAVPDGADA